MAINYYYLKCYTWGTLARQLHLTLWVLISFTSMLMIQNTFCPKFNYNFTSVQNYGYAMSTRTPEIANFWPFLDFWVFWHLDLSNLCESAPTLVKLVLFYLLEAPCLYYGFKGDLSVDFWFGAFVEPKIQKRW